ncbi:MFS transporter [Mycolicibacterium porcinum]|uniref:MFS transporter n=1 Tax=Mycolicibacterium porcinum TaxID=39693 RepID=UPI00080B7E91|nr:MFS transporter [Mycolicibacterium porcinum]OCB11960.1 MFS transporter [Mycolicibacterium porcinum]
MRQRVAICAVFISFGLILGSWAAHLPAVKLAIGASSSQMGAVLLILGVGALTGMQVSGYLVDRIGSGRVALLGSGSMVVTLIPPLVLSEWLPVAVAAAVLGLAIGIAEVGMNAAAVDVERDYRRPIMASFHGMFSVGCVIGALFGALAFYLGIGTAVTAAAIALCGTVLCLGAATTLLRLDITAKGGQPGGTPSSGESVPPRQRARLVVLGALAFLLLLTEGSAMDWSSLHAQQHLNAQSSTGTLALAAFVSAMTIGRFSIDRIAARVGPVRVLRWGSALSLGGLLVVTQSMWLPLTCLGWLLLGLGLSGCVPQVFTATGKLPGESAAALSRVVGAGYLAVLAGPAIVGWLADVVTLNGALALPIVAMAICACTANAVAVPDHTVN